MWTPSPQATSPSRLLSTSPCAFQTEGSFISTPCELHQSLALEMPCCRWVGMVQTLSHSPPGWTPPFSAPPVHSYSAQKSPLHVAFASRLFPLCLKMRTLTFRHLLCIHHVLRYRLFSLRSGNSWVSSSELLCVFTGTPNHFTNIFLFFIACDAKTLKAKFMTHR